MSELSKFTMDGVAYEARKTVVDEIKSKLAECKVTGPADPPDVQALSDTIKRQSETVETLRKAAVEMAEKNAEKDTTIASLKELLTPHGFFDPNGEFIPTPPV